MRILIAPCELKGTLTAVQAAEAIARGLRRTGRDLQLDLAPIGDGGPGTLHAIHTARGGELREFDAEDPNGGTTRAQWLMLPDSSAVVELAQASGLSLIPEGQRRPLTASTSGTGEVLRAALDAGAQRIFLAVGGSATTDGGAGILGALGARFLDAEGNTLPPGGAALHRLARMDLADLDSRISHCPIVVLTDVRSPLLGPTGAAAVFGPQKGASPEDVRALERGLTTLAQVAQDTAGARANPDLAGAGAAGGVGFLLHALLGAALEPGFHRIAEALDLRARLHAAEAVLTAEGRFDAQTPLGKAPGEIARLGREAHRPVVLFTGSTSADADLTLFARVVLIPSSTPVALALEQAAHATYSKPS